MFVFVTFVCISLFRENPSLGEVQMNPGDENEMFELMNRNKEAVMDFIKLMFQEDKHHHMIRSFMAEKNQTFIQKCPGIVEKITALAITDTKFVESLLKANLFGDKYGDSILTDLKETTETVRKEIMTVAQFLTPQHLVDSIGSTKTSVK